MGKVPIRDRDHVITALTIRRQGFALRYAVAIGAMLGVGIVRAMLDPVLEQRSPYTLFLVILPFLAWFVGRGPAQLALLLGGIFGTVWFLPSFDSLYEDPADALALTIYVVVGSISVFLTDTLADLYDRVSIRTTQLEEEVQRRLVIETILRKKEELATEQLVELEAIYHNSPVGLCILDTEGRYLRVNRKLAEMNGLSVADHLGKSLFEIFPNDALVFHDLLDQIKASGEPINSFPLVSRPRNRPHYKQYSLAHWIPLKSTAGELVAISIVVEDITPSKEIENTLRINETRFRLALKNSDLHIAHSGLNLRYTWAFTGNTDPAVFIGKRDDEIFPQPHADTLLQLKQQAIDTQSAVQIETEMRGPLLEGHYILTAEPSYDEHHRVDGVYTTALNITAHKLVERRTRVLYEIATALTGVTTLPEIADIVLSSAFRLLDEHHTGGIRLLTPDGKSLAFVGVQGTASAVSAYYDSIALDAALPAAEAMRLRQPIWVERVQDYRDRYPGLFTSEVPSANVHAMFCIPMILGGRALGTVASGFFHDRVFTPEEREFCMAVAQLCAQAVDRVQLTEKAREAAAIEERQRLARELHDSVNQVLFAATSIAEGIPRILAQDPARAMKLLETVVVTNRAAMAEMRTLLIELRPEALLRSELPDLLSYLVDAAKGRTSIEAELRMQIEPEASAVPPEVHIAFYRIAQEAIHNLVKHSRATRFTVDFKHQRDWVSLRIADNGQGFDLHATSGGLGVDSMRERATTIKADFELTSTEGRGTTVHVHWYYEAAQVS